MIALLLLAAQATAVGAPAPAVAQESAAERWEVDQIRFQPPADTAALQQALQQTHSMAAVIDVLGRQHIAFERVRVQAASTDFPEAVRRQIVALPPGEPFVVPLPQFTTVNMIVARHPADAAADAPIAPALRAAAEELLRETHAEEQMRAAIDQGAAVMRSGANLSAEIDRNDAMKLQRAKNPQAWEAAIAKVGTLQADIMSRLLGELLPELHRRAVAAYAENYTIDELHQLVAFYRSPLGRKSLERAPALTAATGLWFQREFAQRMASALAAIQPEIQRTLGPLLPQPGK